MRVCAALRSVRLRRRPAVPAALPLLRCGVCGRLRRVAPLLLRFATAPPSRLLPRCPPAPLSPPAPPWGVPLPFIPSPRGGEGCRGCYTYNICMSACRHVGMSDCSALRCSPGLPLLLLCCFCVCFCRTVPHFGTVRHVLPNPAPSPLSPPQGEGKAAAVVVGMPTSANANRCQSVQSIIKASLKRCYPYNHNFIIFVSQ